MLRIRRYGRHGVNSIPELELMVNSNCKIGIGIHYLKNIELELKFYKLELKCSTNKIKSTNLFTSKWFNPEIFLP